MNERAVARGADAMIASVQIFFRLLRGALIGAFHDNALATAKAATYSFLLSFFPALLFLANLLAGSRLFPVVMAQFAPVLSRVLPPPAFTLVKTALAGVSPAPIKVQISALLVAIWAASSVMVSWMEGFEAAYNSPPFPIVHQRFLALFLAIVSVFPLLMATTMVSIGGTVELWLAARLGIFQPQLLMLWHLLRWLIAIATTTLIFVVIYHQGINRDMTWSSVYPGALVATFLWLPCTVAFAAYVTRYAEYSSLYGSLAAVVVLMIWMYLLSLAVLVGAEFNSELALHRYSRGQGPGQTLGAAATPEGRQAVES